ncbi:hypothetical protein [Winogradskyella sp. UBA3174]|uniref:hypothetical protein n=1 Tax=Winogradskyella sp. UBA3174 TaxID=1947785 RepID=UPI0025CD6E44|nr:hypothetical protein [Winogradskyella sp. UBA3174]|tara:strand:- start:7384 stop:8148 length:765 start_codon:yes stop_codon:yes gene_type:complete
MKKLIILSLVLCFSFQVESQVSNGSEINNYKYVVVPLKFSFLKGENTYRLNTLTKYLFKQNNFSAFYDKEKLPEDLFKDRCLAIYSDVEDVKGGFKKTKLQVTFTDCYGNLIFTSDVGSSGENKHEVAHQEALRDAFSTFAIKTYKYSPRITDVAVEKETVKTLDKKPKKEIVETIEGLVNTPDSQAFYAQKIDNGYQLVDADPKIVMILLATSAADVYLVKDKNAIVYKENDKWIYSENLQTSIKKEEIRIKF